MAKHRKRREVSAWKGAVAGGIAGLCAAWVMNQFQIALSSAASGGTGPQQSDENATAKAADAVAQNVLHRGLTPHEKRTAGVAIHYGFGSAIGAIYGAAAEAKPPIAAGAGTAFGTALWLAADEVAVPTLSLSRPSLEYPVSTHVSALAAHLVYGVSTDAIRRAVRALL